MARNPTAPIRGSKLDLNPAASRSSEVRNSPLPRPGAGKNISREEIAKRAYEIYKSGKGGSEQDNWLRAERELQQQRQ
jgi:hypothetical protein